MFLKPVQKQEKEDYFGIYYLMQFLLTKLEPFMSDLHRTCGKTTFGKSEVQVKPFLQVK